jgi:hypothetical protein
MAGHLSDHSRGLLVEDNDAKAKAPPYISFRTFLNFLDRVHESGIPSRIDRSYWSRFLNGTVGPQLMVTLRALGLIDKDGVVPQNPLLPALADPLSRKQILGQVLGPVYDSLYKKVPIKTATYGQLEEGFREAYNLKSDTARKGVTFFLAAMEFLGVPVSPFIKEARKSGGRRPGAGRKKRETAAAAATIAATTTTTIAADAAAASFGHLHKSIVGFIEDLPPATTSWSEADIDAWITSFGIILKHVYRKRA